MANSRDIAMNADGEEEEDDEEWFLDLCIRL